MPTDKHNAGALRATVVDGEPALEIGERTLKLETYLTTEEGIRQTDVELETDDQTWWEVRAEGEDVPCFEILLKEVSE